MANHPATNGSKWCRQDKRLAIYLRDGLACVYCGNSLEAGASLSLDHVTPHSAGGSNSETNLVTCCRHCNSVRQDRAIAQWVEDVSAYTQEPAADIRRRVRNHTRRQLARYRDEAKAMIARRGTYAAALDAAGN